MATSSSCSIPYTSGSSPITTIAQDHLFSILLLLPLDSIFCFAMTCKKFRSLTYSDSLWESLCRRDWGNSSIDALRSFAADGKQQQFPWKKIYQQIYQLDSVYCRRLLTHPQGGDELLLPRPRASHSLNFVSGCLILFGGGCEGGSAGDVQEEEEQQIQEQLLPMKSRTPIIETVKRMFSFPTSFPQTSANYWSKLESLIKQGKAYFSPPTVDFRDSQEAQARAEGGATGEKVKEAVLKSLDKSKAAIEESAKSAAKLAGEAVQKTKNKVKRTFSFGDEDPGHQADEL